MAYQVKPHFKVRYVKQPDLSQDMEGWYIISVDTTGEEWDAIGPYITIGQALKLLRVVYIGKKE
jgi:hypothetical protein